MRGKSSGRTADHIYLIVVRDRVVLQDLVDTVREFDRNALVLARSNCTDAIEALKTRGRLKLAFLEAGPGCVSRSRMDVVIGDRGGKLILLGNEAESELEADDREAQRWPLLTRPFTTQAVLRKMVWAFEH
ncbi:hypothetical protein DEA8626_02533 [Defluviimonas aquaemixtae]|uniref:Response regulatory domain-containing protein n=1 Tax=Albidovulum aquaemixtae TaxID=1542388 RepID=A0A2R8BJ86_9RHOB|nr:hypothetical protein [Defluviimonas aquaemixtae]SPH23470.1 hypothetical protein DEA8626_02533 [Defluviimonas aquaemixtae]